MQTPEDFQAELRQEFIDSATDELYTLGEKLKVYEAKGGDSDTLIAQVRRSAHSLKGRGGIFDFPVISVIAHRMEDYMVNMSELGANEILGLHTYIDRMSEILEAKTALSPEATARIVRELPAKRSEFDPDSVVVEDVEVLLVMPKGTALHFVERELQACGYRVITTNTPFSALELAVRTRPDLVVVNLTMEGLPGVDFANALKAMTSTGNIPVALLTSMDKSATDIQALNKDVPVIRKGAAFPDDLAIALEQLNIT